MKKILISFLISFVVMVSGIITVIIGAFQLNQVALILGMVFIILSSIFDFVLGMILLRAWLIRKGA